LTPWRTVPIGGTSTSELIRKIKGADDLNRYYRLDSDAEGVMEKSPYFLAEVAKPPVSVDFVLLTPRELGFESPPEPADFMNADFCSTWSKNLNRQSIGLCDVADGPQIRVHYGEQPVDDKILVAMRQVYDLSEVPCVFGMGVYEGDVAWLYLVRMDKASEVSLDEKYVFRLHTEQ
jgi:hypothetical protein